MMVKKSTPEDDVLAKLRAFLDVEEPKLVYFLVNLWQAQGRAITYKEIREAILAGDLSAKLLLDWQQDYAKFVTDHMLPIWESAMDKAGEDMKALYPKWYYNPTKAGVRDWVEKHGAEFVTNSTQTQIDGLRTIVQRAAVMEDMNVDLLARAVRPMVGLTRDQAQANMNYYQKLLDGGMSQKRATDKAVRYAARQHRYRGYNIARTELSFAYNQGAQAGVKQSQEKGYMGEMVKVWCTADDERVCSICGSLEGKRFAMDEDIYYEFTDRNGNKHSRRINPKLTEEAVAKVPPAHPSCRCAVLYKEVSPPVFEPTPYNVEVSEPIYDNGDVTIEITVT